MREARVMRQGIKSCTTVTTSFAAENAEYSRSSLRTRHLFKIPIDLAELDPNQLPDGITRCGTVSRAQLAHDSSGGNMGVHCPSLALRAPRRGNARSGSSQSGAKI